MKGLEAEANPGIGNVHQVRTVHPAFRQDILLFFIVHLIQFL